MSDTREIPKEYDAIDFDGLERRGNYRTIAYREDMLHVFERRDAAAIIYHIIYRWQTEFKRNDVLKEIEKRKQNKQPPLTPDEVESMMWVYMSYNDFVRESGGAVGYNTVIRTLHYLVHDKKAVEQRANHDPRFPDYEYRVNKEVTKALLKALPAEPVFTPKVPKKKEESTHLGIEANESTQMGRGAKRYTQVGSEYTQTGTASTQMGTEVYPNGGTSQITHSTTTDYITETEESIATAPVASPIVDASLSLQENKNGSHTTQEFIDKLRQWRIEDAQEEATPPEQGASTAQQNHSASSLPVLSAAVVGEVAVSQEVLPLTPAKWNAAAMVTLAESLRGRTFSAAARKKEASKAHSLFERKPDLTEGEFIAAWENWDTDWWRKTNGPFTISDLAAIPKGKSEMRLILALDKLAAPLRIVPPPVKPKHEDKYTAHIARRAAESRARTEGVLMS